MFLKPLSLPRMATLSSYVSSIWFTRSLYSTNIYWIPTLCQIMFQAMYRQWWMRETRFHRLWILRCEKDYTQVKNWISDNKGKMVSVVEKRILFIMVIKESYSEVTLENWERESGTCSLMKECSGWKVPQGDLAMIVNQQDVVPFLHFQWEALILPLCSDQTLIIAIVSVIHLLLKVCYIIILVVFKKLRCLLSTSDRAPSG